MIAEETKKSITQYTKPQKTNTLQKLSTDEKRGEFGVICIEVSKQC